jgi:GNAT superfamily N-acetyltransferase
VETKEGTRPAETGDIDAMIAVKDAATAGWDPPSAQPDAERIAGQRQLFEHLLETGSSAVAMREGAVVGFANAIVREDVWFLSQLFVRPDVQSRGAGAEMLDDLLARGEARGARVRSVLSSDDPRALGLYLSRGMLPAGWSMVHFTRRVASKVKPTPAPVVPLQVSDQPQVDALDRDIRGFAHPQDHAFLRTVATGHAVRDDAGMAACFYVQPNGRVAPFLARDDRSVIAAVDAADAIAGPDASWSVPSAASAVVARLLDLGYRPGWLSTFCADGTLGEFRRTSLTGGALL